MRKSIALSLSLVLALSVLGATPAGAAPALVEKGIPTEIVGVGEDGNISVALKGPGTCNRITTDTLIKLSCTGEVTNAFGRARVFRGWECVLDFEEEEFEVVTRDSRLTVSASGKASLTCKATL